MAYLAIVHRHWRLAHACCFVDQLAGIAQHTVALSSTSSFPQRVTPTTKGCCTVRLKRKMAHRRWSFLDAGLVRARASAYTCTSSGSYAPTLNDFIYVPVGCKHFFASYGFAFFVDRAEHFRTCSFQCTRTCCQDVTDVSVFPAEVVDAKTSLEESPIAVHASFSVGHL